MIDLLITIPIQQGLREGYIREEIKRAKGMESSINEQTSYKSDSSFFLSVICMCLTLEYLTRSHLKI